MRVLILPFVLLIPAPAPALTLCEPGLLVEVADLAALAIIEGAITEGESAGLCRIRLENGAQDLRHPAVLQIGRAGDTPPEPDPVPDAAPEPGRRQEAQEQTVPAGSGGG